MIHLFAVAICNAARSAGNKVRAYHDTSASGRAFWDAKAVEVLPGVLAALIWKWPRRSVWRP